MNQKEFAGHEMKDGDIVMGEVTRREWTHPTKGEIIFWDLHMTQRNGKTVGDQGYESMKEAFGALSYHFNNTESD
jgi:hypothetical protein